MIHVLETPIKLILEGDSDELATLAYEFRFHPLGYYHSTKYQQHVLTDGKEGWDGYIYPLWRLSRNFCESAVLPRGRKMDLIRYALENKIELESELMENPLRDLELDDVRDDLIAGEFKLDQRQRLCILEWLRQGVGFCKVSVGGGKCLGKGTPVMLYSGKSVPVEQLRPGDQLMGPDSKPRRVLSTSKGNGQLYLIQQKNGSPFVCNDEHVLALQKYSHTGNARGPNFKRSITRHLFTVKEFLGLPAYFRRDCRMYKAGVEFKASAVPLNAYFLGLWLGDGSAASAAVTTGDQEIELFLSAFACAQGLTLDAEKGTGCKTWHLYTARKAKHDANGAKNSVTGWLKKLGVRNNKQAGIPEIYRFNCRAVRLALLAGLIDSDGHKKEGRKAQVELTSVYPKLAEDITWLARSLGYSASCHPKRTKCQTEAQGVAYRVRITGNMSEVPTKVARKKLGNDSNHGLRTDFTVTSLGTGDYYGFTLDGDHLFLLGDFTVTHNTETFAGAAALIKERYDKARFIYITPSERLVRQTAQRMTQLLPNFEIGQYGGSKHQKDAADMVVCTVSILHHNFRTLLSEGWFDTFSALLYDEVHHCAAPSSQKVLDVIPAFFRLGASDTAKAKDPAKYFAIRGQFGPRLVEVTSAPLISEGRLAPPHIYVVDLPSWTNRHSHVKLKPSLGSTAYVLWDGQWVKGKYRGPVYEIDEKTGLVKTKKFKTARQNDDDTFIVEERPVIVGGLHQIEIGGVVYEMESRWCLLDRLMDQAIVQFQERNELIRQWVAYFHRAGRSTVVVATRTSYVYILEALLKKSINPELVRILTGHEKDSPVQRDEMFRWFKDTPGAVLITPLIKEGISINEISAMVVADFVADPEVARQIIGRAMRPKKKDNRAHVVWFTERQHPQLLKSSQALLKTLEETESFHYYHPCAGPETVQGMLL